MDHPVELSRLRQEGRDTGVGQAPVVLGIGDAVEHGCIVFGVICRISVKRNLILFVFEQIIVDQFRSGRGILGSQCLDLCPGEILKDLGRPLRRIIKISRGSDREEDTCQEECLYPHEDPIAARRIFKQTDMPQKDSPQSEKPQNKCLAAGPGKGIAPGCAHRRQYKHEHKGRRQLSAPRFHEFGNCCCNHIADQKRVSPHPAVCRIGKTVHEISRHGGHQQAGQSDKSSFEIKMLFAPGKYEQDTERRNGTEAHICP